jgi:hypothetical protein
MECWVGGAGLKAHHSITPALHSGSAREPREKDAKALTSFGFACFVCLAGNDSGTGEHPVKSCFGRRREPRVVNIRVAGFGSVG